MDEFVTSATGGASGRAQRLLKLFPAIASANLYTAIVVGDAETVDTLLRAQPDLATRSGGPQNWEPLLYACHTCVHNGNTDGLVAIARRLIALGANPNAEYHWNWHPELPRTALWAALCVVRHLPLAETLLEAGARATDGVSTHIAGGAAFLPALDLLHHFGMNVNGVPGGVPPLAYILFWSTDIRGPQWLLEHSADPNLAWGDAGEAPLHIAARRWNVALVELLVAHGADITMRRADGRTPHTLAALHGNQDIASWLLAHGAIDELSPLEQFIAICARGDRPQAESMLERAPQFRADLQHEHHLMLQRPAQSGNAKVLETMLACGFDPAAADKDKVTALHRAAMGGHVDAVRVLLSYGAPVNALDGMFSATPLVWAVEGRNSSHHAGDHVGVARLLIEAGSSTEWAPPPGAPNPEGTLEGLLELRRAAE